MPKKRRVEASWTPGDYFVVPLADGSLAVGQVLDEMMENIVSVAFLDRRQLSSADARNSLLASNPRIEEVFAKLSTWRDPLDSGRWEVVGHAPPVLPQELWPNEEFRSREWVGAKHVDAELAEDFLKAFYALAPWDSLFDPDYYERFLVSADKKPFNLLYSK